MAEILKTIVLLSLTGSISVVILLILKGLLLKRFSGRLQLFLWLFAMVTFVIPVWKAVPVESVEPLIIPYGVDEVFSDGSYYTPEANYNDNIQPNVQTEFKREVDVVSILVWVWVAGVCIFVLLTIGSYALFLVNKRKNSGFVEHDELFDEVKNSLKIKRRIRIRKCNDSDSPFLAGVFFPVIYVPENRLSDEEMRLIYLHELTHYKHRDLLIKWLLMLVNAVHWFNPFCYVIVKNVNEVCEISCDMKVTENMDENKKKLYMSTILNLVSKKGVNDV